MTQAAVYEEPRKEKRRRRGFRLLVAAVVFFVISYGMYALDLSPATQGSAMAIGIFEGLIALAMVVSLVVGIIYLVGSFIAKE